MLETKNTVIEIENIFDGLISRQDMAEEIISEHENISIDTSKKKCKEKKD